MWYSETLGVIKTPKEFMHNGITYPRQVFRKWGKPELAELGIRPARVVTPDSRYYNTGGEDYELVDGEWVISYAETEKEVGPLKEQTIQKIKFHVGSLLLPSDWRIIRQEEGYKVAGSDWEDWRGAVRSHGNALEVEVEAIATLDDMKAFNNHRVSEVRYVSTYVDAEETIGPETETHQREVDKTTWGWPVAPDAEADPYHVRYE
jgi:hypothetical protein